MAIRVPAHPDSCSQRVLHLVLQLHFTAPALKEDQTFYNNSSSAMLTQCICIALENELLR